MALAFALMIPAAFQLGQLLTQYSQNKIQNKQLVVAIHLILIFMLGSVIKNVWPKAEGYNYLQDAASWIKVNNPNHEPVFYSDKRMQYYAEKKFDGIRNDDLTIIDNAIQDQSIYKYDYLLIRISEGTSIPKELTDYYTEKTRFYNANKKKYVAIFKRHAF